MGCQPTIRRSRGYYWGHRDREGSDISWREKWNNSLTVITSMNCLIVLRCISQSSLIHIYFVCVRTCERWEGERQGGCSLIKRTVG